MTTNELQLFSETNFLKWKQFENNVNKSIIFSNNIKNSNPNDPCLVIIYLKICKICNNEHIKELYSNMAKNI